MRILRLLFSALCLTLQYKRRRWRRELIQLAHVRKPSNLKKITTITRKRPGLFNRVNIVCHLIKSAASTYDLPLVFLIRLIWQESRFDLGAVSPAGAQGVAQFMPGTAIQTGLANPFDAVEAIPKSAELLRDLKTKFGNLGLAAAAYNAGPKRVEDWLAGRSSLPKETQAYVQIVTGHAASEWAGETSQVNLALPDAVPCGANGELSHHSASLKVATTIRSA